MISHEVIKKAGYKLWTDSFERGLDYSSQNTIEQHDRSEPYRIMTEEIMLIGIKSDVNITPWERISKGRESIDVREVYRVVGGEERALIHKL